ncbi:hypothetical protein MTR_5g006790 [Medicago truncatula]|uniref:Uncharacterized protein n=1 Tax=Medicago truncatula TaxID=3880 RepID=G7K3S3_MEDTR|nr:hypothetical protein MTR_5g006790 [Medicago truncatula]
MNISFDEVQLACFTQHQYLTTSLSTPISSSTKRTTPMIIILAYKFARGETNPSVDNNTQGLKLSVSVSDTNIQDWFQLAESRNQFCGRQQANTCRKYVCLEMLVLTNQKQLESKASKPDLTIE